MKRVVMTVLGLVVCFLMLSTTVVMAQEPCEGNFDFDEDVDGTDAVMFKEDFGRSAFSNPCPVSPCPVICEGTLSTGGRWCDRGDGTVRDMTTGLVWLQKADWGGRKKWADCSNFDDAHTRVARLWDGSPWEGEAGLSDLSIEGDWRLPTKNELVSITVGTEYIQSSSMYFFTGVESSYYWSSTTYANMAGAAWHVFMHDGGEGLASYDIDYYVWPVRGGH